VVLDRVGLTASKDCSLQKTRPILTGVSGGADSLCLLDLLYRLGYPLVVAHFNHQLRPEAADDARQVEAAAQERGAAFVLGTADVAGYAASHALPVEEAARELRYRFLFEQARRCSAQAVAVGHTADDQVETVLMHLLRGSGLGGLKGMSFSTLLPAWDAALPLVRPLLSTWREETQAYCAQNGLHPVVDATNTDPAYLRNRVRLDLIPLLETYNPRFRLALYRTASILAGDDQALNQVIEGLWPGCLAALGPGYAALDREKVLRLAPGLQRGILRRALGQLRPTLRDVDLEMVERALQFFVQPARSGQMDLADGLRLMHESGQVYLVDGRARLPAGDWPQIEGPSTLSLDAPGEIALSAGWKLAACLLPDESLADVYGTALANPDSFQAWVDADLARFPLVVRPRRSGDRWQPLGLEKGSQKLSDFFVNEKCPPRARARWPLLCSGDQILWIPGYRPSQACRLSTGTRKILHLRVWRVRASQSPPVVSTSG
jgi:tRNA(Ile)-lysidine synthase